MHLLIRSALIMGLFVVVLAGVPGNALAQDATEDRLNALEERLRQQDEEILRLKEQLDDQSVATDAVGTELDNYLSKVEDNSDWMKPDTFRVFWKNGLNMATSDGAFKLKIGGRLMSDWNWFDADSDLKDMFSKLDGATLRQTEMRRARLYISGTIYELVEFKAQYDFAGGDADFKDVWVGLKKLPIFGNFRVGQQKINMGLETLTSSKYITFIERGGVSALLPDRQSGFQTFNSVLDDRLGWSASYYTPATNDYGNGPINNGLSARVFGTPWFDKSDEGTNLLHLGFSLASEDGGKGEMFELENRPPNHTSPIKPISIEVEAESRMIYQGEIAFVFGPFSVQAEYVQQNYDSSTMDDPSFNAWYVYGSWFITGEQRPYKASYGVFDRVKPKANFWDGKGGAGAWELAIRYGSTDADDRGVYGGSMDSLTIGLNWYINPNMMVKLNYFSSNIESTDSTEFGESGIFYDVTDKGKMTGFMMRFQIDF